MQPIFLEPGEGKSVTARGSKMIFKAVEETTEGLFSSMERELPTRVSATMTDTITQSENVRYSNFQGFVPIGRTAALNSFVP